MMTPEERYLTDPMFHALVDRLGQEIQQARFTPSELREAVILAAIQYEMRNPMPRSWQDDEEFAVRQQIARRSGRWIQPEGQKG